MAINDEKLSGLPNVGRRVVNTDLLYLTDGASSFSLPGSQLVAPETRFIPAQNSALTPLDIGEVVRVNGQPMGSNFPVVDLIDNVLTQAPIGVVAEVVPASANTNLLIEGPLTVNIGELTGVVGQAVFANNSGKMTFTDTGRQVATVMAVNATPGEYNVHVSIVAQRAEVPPETDTIDPKTTLIPIQNSNASAVNFGDAVAYVGDEPVEGIPEVARVTSTNTQSIAGIVDTGGIPANTPGSILRRGRRTLQLPVSETGGQVGDGVYVVQNNHLLTLEKTSRARIGTIVGLDADPSTYVVYIDVTNAIQAEQPCVVVNSLTDLPPAIGGVRTLAPNTCYSINADITLTNERIVTNVGSSIVGALSGVSALRGTGAGANPLILGNTASLRIQGMQLANDPGNIVVDFDGLNANRLEIESTQIFGGSIAVRTTQHALCALINTDIVGATTNVQLVGNCFKFKWTGGLGETDGAGTILDYGASVNQIIFVLGIAFQTTAMDTVFSGLANNGNLISTGDAKILSNTIIGNGATVFGGGLTADDTQFIYTSNDGIEDSQPIGSMYLVNNAVPTPFIGANLPAKVEGVTQEGLVSQWDMTADNRLDFLPPNDKRLTVKVQFQALKGGGGSPDDYTFFVYKNAIPLPFSATQISVDNTEPRSGSIFISDNFTQGDFIELYAENNSTGTDLVVTNFQFIVS